MKKRAPIPLGRYARLDPSDRLGLVLLISLTLHSALFLVSFKMPDMKKSDLSTKMEVVLVNSKSASRPVKADALAQANLDGGGNTDAERQAKSPLPVLDQPQQESEATQKQQQVSQLEQQAKLLMTQVKSTQYVDPISTKAKPAEAPVEKSGSDLATRSLEAARLEAQIARDWEAYQKKPKRNFVGARTREDRFARYTEDWRIKVEKVGNLNYPDEARRNKIYGSVRLAVSIKADGSVEKIEISRSSGHPVLNDAAIRIVKLAAPYAAFPEDIRKDTDILDIVRTFTFTRADQLDAE